MAATSPNADANKPAKSKLIDTRFSLNGILLFVLVAVSGCIVIWVVWWLFPFYVYQKYGIIIDEKIEWMNNYFNLTNSLFTGIGLWLLAITIFNQLYSLFLQRESVRIQKQDLKLARIELKKSANALQEQVAVSANVARLQALPSLIEHQKMTLKTYDPNNDLFTPGKNFSIISYADFYNKKLQSIKLAHKIPQLQNELDEANILLNKEIEKKDRAVLDTMNALSKSELDQSVIDDITYSKSVGGGTFHEARARVSELNTQLNDLKSDIKIYGNVIHDLGVLIKYLNDLNSLYDHISEVGKKKTPPSS